VSAPHGSACMGAGLRLERTGGRARGFVRGGVDRLVACLGRARGWLV
jgi:hypothetical protein